MEYYRKLIQEANDATKAYEEGKPYMSDAEWDLLYYTIEAYEQEHGFVDSDSPTQKVHYEVVNELKKVEHNHLMLSLDKTKSEEEVEAFLGNQDFIAMCKMDGLTCSLHYLNGKLVGAETRGNGHIGEDILHNAMVIPSIPKYISYMDELVIDGEIICCLDTFSNFFSTEYKNARNFAAGSIRLLDARECEKRHLTFVAWDVLKGFDALSTLEEYFYHLRQMNFIVVPWYKGKVKDAIPYLQHKSQEEAYPIDGIVFKFNKIEYGRSLGATEHHFKNAIAYKFYDELYETKLQNIEWTMGRTGALTPVAIFDPVEIDGTEVSRANMFNISIMEELLGDPYKGQVIYVYKANQIIPQIEKAEKKEKVWPKERIYIEAHCPYCGCETWIDTSSNAEILRCGNSACSEKLINKLEHFCGKKGLDIKGLSVATLEKLIKWKWIYNFSDIFKLKELSSNWKLMPGFGEASVTKILKAIEYARNNSTHESFISAIGIPLIGRAMVKELAKNGVDTYHKLRELVDDRFDFSQFVGFGYEKSESLLNFNFKEADAVYHEMNLIAPKPKEEKESKLSGINFVITGTLRHFKNRAELQKAIEAAGGKVVGSISKNTSYLINNDIESTSSKNQAAKRLGIPIISEEKFLELI